MDRPLILSDRITTRVGDRVGPTGIALQNPLNQPILIDAIQLRSATSSAASALLSTRCRFKWDQEPISDFVHLPLFHSTVHNYWIPDTPIWIRPRGFLYPELYTSNESGSGSQTIQLVYYCRSTTVTPRKIKLPWVAQFTSAGMDGGTDSYQVSKPSELRNPFSDQVVVKRFIGRLVSNGLTAAQGLNLRFRYALVKMFDHQRNIVVRDRTPFSMLFNTNDTTWPVNVVLPARGYYTVQLDTLMSNFASGRSPLVYGMVSMVCEREISVIL